MTMFKVLLALGALFATTAALGQDKAPAPDQPVRQRPWQLDIPHKAFKERGQAGYLEAILGLKEREHDAKAKNDRSLYLDMYITHLVLANEYAQSKKLNSELMGLFGSPQRGVKLREGDAPTDAIAYILKAAESHQIVMFNEEHRSSIQRAFMNRILPELRERGFTYLAIEAVYDGQDAAINEKGYPTLKAGLYVSDPSFGDMIRQARELGFTIVAYDAHEERKPGMDPIESTNTREAGQARNIHAKTLAKDPKAKVVVYGGRHHISEEQSKSGWKPMGGVLKALAGVDPLTVDLMMMVETDDPKQQAPAYTDAAAKGWLDNDPVVIVNDKGETLTDFYKGMLDVLVFHPRTKWVEGRPHWMQMGGLRRPVRVEIDPKTVTEPLLLQAFVAGEAEDAIPVDQVVVWKGGDGVALMLRSGTYRVRAINRDGKSVLTRELAVP